MFFFIIKSIWINHIIYIYKYENVVAIFPWTNVKYLPHGRYDIVYNTHIMKIKYRFDHINDLLKFINCFILLYTFINQLNIFGWKYAITKNAINPNIPK